MTCFKPRVKIRLADFSAKTFAEPVTVHHRLTFFLECCFSPRRRLFKVENAAFPVEPGRQRPPRQLDLLDEPRSETQPVRLYRGDPPDTGRRVSQRDQDGRTEETGTRRQNGKNAKGAQ